MRRPQAAQEPEAVESAGVVVEILRNFHINAPTDVPDCTVRRFFVAGDKHVVDKETADLWTAQGHARIVDAE